MQSITSITQKGQLTIPKHLRQKLGLTAYSKVHLTADKNSIKIVPTYDILDLAGQFKPKQKKEILKARQQMDEDYKRF